MQGTELRKIRRGKLDLSQAELAIRLGVSVRTVSQYETQEEPIPRAIELAVKCLADTPTT